MDEARKKELTEIYNDILNAPFETWEHEGKFYHNVGLMNAWVKGYTKPEVHMFAEPPQWTDEFNEWLKDHDSNIGDFFVGPPHIVFPNKATAEEFKVEWHDKARIRFPYKECDHYDRVIKSENERILSELRDKSKDN